MITTVNCLHHCALFNHKLLHYNIQGVFIIMINIWNYHEILCWIVITQMAEYLHYMYTFSCYYGWWLPWVTVVTCSLVSEHHVTIATKHTSVRHKYSTNTFSRNVIHSSHDSNNSFSVYYIHALSVYTCSMGWYGALTNMSALFIHRMIFHKFCRNLWK